MSEVKFEIREKIGVISKSKTGWAKEVNLVAWGDRPPKLDIREWDEEHFRMSKGLTLTFKEARKLQELLKKYIEEHGNELAEALE